VRRRLLALLAPLSLLALAQSGDYYPLKTGLRWTYSNGEVQEVSATRTINGRSVAVLTHSTGGKVTQEDYLAQAREGLLLHGSQAGDKLTWYEQPLLVYPAAPLYPGARWSTTTRAGDGSSVSLAARVLGSEGVVTPAGRFNAFVVRTTVVTSSGGSSLTDSYFVAAVGTVRFVTQDGSTVDLVERK